VGTGTGASCTESALDACLPGGGSFDGTVTFNCGGAATITVTSTKLISADTTIDGGSLITISGGNSVGVFHSNNVNFTVQNLTIANGETANGGGIHNEGGTLTVTNSIFSGNSAGGVGFGGGIDNVGGTLAVTNSTFSGNSAGGRVSPLGGSGGGIHTEGGTLTVTNSIFSGNSVGGFGGGIHNQGGTLTVTDSTFSGNSGGVDLGPYGGGGGGIAHDFDNPTASVRTATVTNSTFSGNSAGNTGGVRAGGGIGSGSTLTVTNSTFFGNSAGGSGGGIFSQTGRGATRVASLTVTNSTFSGNSAGFGGNYPGQTGGGICNDAGTAMVTNTVIANSTADNCGSSCIPVINGGHNIDDGTTCGFTGTGCSTTTGTSFCNTNPVLDPTGLQSNGGPTQTIALQSGSPAINAGDESVCAAPPVNNLDQRGLLRPGTGATNCSIGAFEANPAAPWPMFRHDLRHTGRSPVDTSANPGTQKWAFATGGPVHYSSPTIGADGTIYIGSYDYHLYAINSDGTQKWAFATGAEVLSASAIGADGTIYVGSNDNNLYAINPDGTQKWAFAAGGAVRSPAIGADGTIYVGSHDPHLYAINPDGTQKWAFATGTGTDSSPAIGANGTIYAGGGFDLYAINPDGTQQWAFAAGPVYNSPSIGADGTIYVASQDSHLYAINPDGTQQWAFAGGQSLGQPAIGADGTIYVGGSGDHHLYAINPDGTQQWAFATGDRVDSSPAIGADGTIYVGSADGYVPFPYGHLYAINPNGTQKWAFAGGYAGDSSPAIGADGTIYVGSADGHLYALGGAPSSTPTNTPSPTPTASTTPLPVCGNGAVEGTEQCDDGNPSNNDACKNDCTANICGDGFVRSGVEACDDGNLVSGDGCEADCSYTPVSQSAGAGETVTTDTSASGATPEFPVQSSVTTPNAGTVSITTEVVTSPPAAGVEVVGVAFHIVAPPASAANPLVLVFRIDASQLPTGIDPDTITVFKDGVLVATCNSPGGVASPDPCVSDRHILGDGDVQITVLTSSASQWMFAIPLPHTCGNGVLETLEQCDDGNLVSGDGCSASCQYELIPGNSSRVPATDKRACLLEWSVVNPTNSPARDSRGRLSNVQTCRDNDATCDFDPTGRVCEFHVVACLNNTDPQLPTCVGQGVRAGVDDRRGPGIDILVPNRIRDLGNYSSLKQALQQFRDPNTGGMLSLPIDEASRNFCSAPFAIRVPVRGTTRLTPGQVRLLTLTRAQANSPIQSMTDLDSLTLVCKP
jgi:cysteine-rich repeat protein